MTFNIMPGGCIGMPWHLPARRQARGPQPGDCVLCAVRDRATVANQQRRIYGTDAGFCDTCAAVYDEVYEQWRQRQENRLTETEEEA